MTLQTRLTDLVLAIGTDYKQLRVWLTGSSTGSLTGLTTTDKSSVVNAINEVKAGNTGTPPIASQTQQGLIEIATNAETLALSSTVLAVTPANIASILDVALGVPKLDATGKIKAAQLPGYVDDVLEVTNFAALPATGQQSGVLYVTINDNKVFRWTGTVYVEISAAPGTTDAVAEGTTNLYYTTARWDARSTTILGNVETDLTAAYTAAKA